MRLQTGSTRLARLLALAALLLAIPWPAGFRAASRAVIGEKAGATPAASPGAPDNTFYGIGAVLGSEGAYVKIQDVVTGGPADRDGRLKPGDCISGIAEGDGPFVDCTNLPTEKVIAMIRGKKDTAVRLEVIEPGVNDPKLRKVVTLVREQVKVDAGGAFVATGAKADPTANLSADDKAKVEDAVKQINEAKRKLLDVQMKDEIDQVVKATGLDATGKQALEAASAKAIDQSLEKSKYSILKILPRGTTGTSISTPFLKQLTAAPQAFATWSMSQGGSWPADQAIWKDALTETLSPTQAVAWDAVLKQRQADAEKEMGRFLDAIVQVSIKRRRPEIEAKADQVEAALQFPKDRQDKFKAMIESVLTTYGDNARDNAKRQMLVMGDQERKAAQKQGFYRWIPNGPDDLWNKALAGFLTDAEKKTLQESHENIVKRRAQAMGRLTVAMLDAKIAFTDAQRQQLEPIIERLVEGNSNLVGDRQANNYFTIPVSTFYSVAAGANEAEIKAILDPVQWRLWRELSGKKDAGDDSDDEPERSIPAVENAAKTQAAAEPLDVDGAISDYMEKKSAEEYTRLLAENMLKAEDAARVAKLAPDATERLLTAARGAAEDAIGEWNSAAESMVRGNVGDATPDTIKQRLASIESYEFSNAVAQQGDSQNGNGDAVWNRTVKALLNADQSKAWKTEIDARKAYLNKAAIGSVLCTFDERIGLSTDQWAKLSPLVEKIVNDYSGEFGQYYSSNPPTAWFLQSFTMWVPIVGIPDKDIKPILTADQWKQWSGSGDYSNAMNMWQNIDRVHRQQAVGGRMINW